MDSPRESPDVYGFKRYGYVCDLLNTGMSPEDSTGLWSRPPYRTFSKSRLVRRRSVYRTHDGSGGSWASE